MWRSCRNILPTKNRLKSRGISIEDCCDQCGLSESSGHILWGCKLSLEVWSESRLKLPYILGQMQEFIELVWDIIEKKPNIDWELFAVVKVIVQIIKQEKGRSKRRKKYRDDILI